MVTDARAPGELLGSGRHRLRMRLAGVPIEWEESPFEWRLYTLQSSVALSPFSMLHNRTKAKISFSSVLSFVAVLSGLVGIPRMMDDLAVWQGWIAGAREVIPWQLAMLVAGGTFVGAILPWLPWKRLRATTDKSEDLRGADVFNRLAALEEGGGRTTVIYGGVNIGSAPPDAPEIKIMSQAEYDALLVKKEKTVYLIVDRS